MGIDSGWLLVRDLGFGVGIDIKKNSWRPISI